MDDTKVKEETCSHYAYTEHLERTLDNLRLENNRLRREVYTMSFLDLVMGFLVGSVITVCVVVIVLN
jgi:hypothetical protein